ncbi:MAG TPA: hypothetical protein VGE72_26765, partial [Azospirillum sp.]
AAASSSVRQTAVGVVGIAEDTPTAGGASSGVEAATRWGARVAGTPATTPAATGLCTAGQKVEVLWERQWWPATVRGGAEPDGRCPVGYDGYGREYDEAVPPHRLRAKGR